MVDIHRRKLQWVYCPEHAGVKGNVLADRLAGKATLTSGSLLGRSEVLRSLRHNLRAQRQAHHTSDRLEERGEERGSARRCSFKGREGHRQPDEHWNCFKGNPWETSERRDGAHMGFSERINTILNWTELSLFLSSCDVFRAVISSLCLLFLVFVVKYILKMKS